MPKGILVNFENSFKLKKIPCMPPIYHDNNYITDFKEKAQIINYFLLRNARQLKILANFRPIPLKEQITFFQLSRLLKMILQKSLKILIRIKPMTLT